MLVVPAYGRDYKSAKEAKADWKAGKDFIINDFFSPYDGKPCSIRDTKDQEKSIKIMIRYDRLRKVTQA